MKKTRRGIIFIILTILSMVFVACQPQTGDSIKTGAEGLITIEDELGQTSLEGVPQRIVVFDYGILDALDNIGQDIIGLPKQSLPAYLNKYKGKEYIDLGSLKEPSLEAIYEANPDLIIISARQVDLYRELNKIAPTIYLNIKDGDYLNSFKNNMQILGEVFQEEGLLATKVEEVVSQIDKVKEKAKENDMNGLFIMANDGNLSAYGLGSRFGILHKEFGLKPADEGIDSSTHGQKITFEYIVEKDPDYLFVMDRAAVAGGDISAKQVLDNDLIKSTRAYKNDRIIYLDAHVWYVSSGGLTGTMRMAEEVINALEK